MTQANPGAAPSTPADHAADALVLTYVLDAPRELVFKVWTDPKHLAHWWGPKGFAMEVQALDLRPDGVFHYCQRSPEGQALWGKFVYREIVAPERLAFVSSFADEAGNTIRNPWSPEWPMEILNVLTLSEEDGKTTLTMRGTPVNATPTEHQTFKAAQEMVRKGFGGTFEQLTAYLADLTEGGEA